MTHPPVRELMAIIALSSLAAASPVLAGSLATGTADGVSLWRILGALLLCLTLGVGAALGLKARGGGFTSLTLTQSRQIKILDRVKLSHQIDICLLECGDKRYLLAASPAGCAVLAVHDADVGERHDG